MKQGSHHHGNLYEALIEAGIDMLAGGQALTLRGAATRAGVSHSAPAHHFDGLDGLRTAIAARAMTMLGSRLKAAGRDPDHTPFQRLLDMSQAYCDFAAKNAHLFQLMFSSPDVDRTDPALLQASVSALTQLSRVCAPFVGPDSKGWVLEHTIWSITHGNAVLLLQTRCRNDVAPVSAPALEAQYRLVLRPEDDPA